jgi:chromosome segregation ATPase
MTITELQNEYDTLEAEKTQITAQIADIVKEIDPIEKQIASLKDQATEFDLKISEQPSQVYNKECHCAFICIGKTCQEIPGPNPAIASLISQRNDLIRQSNDLQRSIDGKGQQISDLTARQVEIQTRQNEIRGLLIAEQQKLLPAETVAGTEVLGTLKKYLPYILIGGGVLIFTIIIIKRR